VSPSTWRPIVDGKQTALLRFNCFDLEEKLSSMARKIPELTTPGRVGGAWACTAA